MKEQPLWKKQPLCRHCHDPVTEVFLYGKDQRPLQACDKDCAHDIVIVKKMYEEIWNKEDPVDYKYNSLVVAYNKAQSDGSSTAEPETKTDPEIKISFI